MTTKDAVEKLSKELRRDKKFYETYQANISMCFFDTYHKYIKKFGRVNADKYLIQITNEAAKKYLDLFISK